MSKIVGFINEQKIYDDNLKLAKHQQNVSYTRVAHEIDDLALPHCQYCGHVTYAIHKCLSCGAPLT